MVNLNQWLQQIDEAISRRDVRQLTIALHPTLHKIDPAFLRKLDPGIAEGQTRRLFRTWDGAISTLCFHFLLMAQELVKEPVSWRNALTPGISCLTAWIEAYRRPEAVHVESLMVPGLVTLCRFLIYAADEADKKEEASIADGESPFVDDEVPEEDERWGGAEDLTENRQKVLNAMRQHIGKFRGDDSRQAAYVVLLGASMQVCVMLRNMQMAAAFLKTVESSAINIAKVPRAPLANFRYYLGNLHMQQENFVKSQENLRSAFLCSKSHKFKRQVLEALVAVRLRLGLIPPLKILKKYDMLHYRGIVQAVITGNIRLFVSTMAEHESKFIGDGTLLCLEKVKFIVYRTLVKRVVAWVQTKIPNQKGEPINIMPLGIFAAAFKWQIEAEFVEFSLAEMACILANLIKLGYVKGYIAWDQAKVVLSKKDPIPRLGHS